MDENEQGIRTLIKRTNLTGNIEQLLVKIQKQYFIGQILDCEPILEGYEDANFLISTLDKKYVLKIFSKSRSKSVIASYVKILEQASSIHVPVINLVLGSDRAFLHAYAQVSYILTDFFEGNNFEEEKNTTRQDIISLTAHIAHLNTLNFPVEEDYDSWGNKNLIKEYERTKQYLLPDQMKLLNPAITRFSDLDFSRFSKAVIHGDMQRKHVLKNNKGEYCILDFGCASYDAKLIELSTFLAWFCLSSENWNKKDEIIQTVVDEYQKIHMLSVYELESIPALIQAAYASYFLRTSVLINTGDTSTETKQWHEEAKQMLEKT
ncbi:phosphotransferase [Candidatus Roizmanbacteria bacterium]|nr:phosphotransferase [Candidatus Roizmanbacteria bacterium]